MKLRKIIDDFFRSDSLQILAQDAGRLLDCPLMIVDNAFRVQASHQPPALKTRCSAARWSGGRSPTRTCRSSARTRL